MSTKKTRCGVDPVLSGLEDVDPPFCPHGPTLLFNRYYAAGKEPRKFYACAVHRDRKGCNFFCYADDAVSIKAKRDRWKEAFEEEQSSLNTKGLSEKQMIIKSLPPVERHYCPKCGIVLTSGELPSHKDHPVIKELTDLQLSQPTSLLSPVDDRKSKAQFFFSDTSLNLLRDELRRLQFNRVLCIGTPRLHEMLLKEDGVRSLLLDIDHRYLSFYSADHYQRYNMFSHFFYESTGIDACQRFLSEGPVAMVIDPPFGGLVELLAISIRKLWEMAGSELPVFLIFPYFLEDHVTSALPTLWMTDYQVTYLNHKYFSSRKKQKPSPVRIFTNTPLPGLKLPKSEGYRLCKCCNRYVAKLNAHCEKCGTCTSKDGRCYVHCELCGKCVKQSWVHCSVCKKCEAPDHTCGSKSAIGCHICGSLGHKRKDCPTKEELVSTPPRKRKKKL